MLEPASSLVHSTVTPLSAGVTPTPEITGSVVSTTMALLAARLVVGTKLVIALLAPSAIVPLIDLTVKSALVSPS